MDSIGISITGYLLAMAAVTLLMALYFCAILFVIARKTATPGSWMAWVPIANIFLMCRIARKPWYFALLLIVPLLNLVIGILLWMAIAQARGKSPVLGVLMIVPVLNLIAGVLLASGPGTGVRPQAAAGPAVCPACGSEECVGEDFCGYTGQRIVGMAATAPAAAPVAAEAQPGMLAKVILGIVLTFGGTYFGMGLLHSAKKFFGGGAASGATPGGSGSNGNGTVLAKSSPVPARAAGTLTEFPVDTGPTPARPTSVVSQNLRIHGSAPKFPPRSLPASLSESQLPTVADAITTATYQAAPTDPPVSVHVLNTTEASVSHILSDRLRAGAGPETQTTGVRVQSPSGAEYTGFRVRTPQDETYILDKTGAPVTIVIFAPEPSVTALADRLAGNVGNGNGLADDPALAASMAALPSALPPGVKLVESNTFTAASLSGSLEQLAGSLNANFGPESRQWIEQARRFIPPQLSTARYVDQNSQEFNIVVGDYGGRTRAWTTWQVVRSTLGLAGLQPVDVAGGSGLGMTEGGKRAVLFTRGGCLGYVTGPDDRVVRLAESVAP